MIRKKTFAISLFLMVSFGAFCQQQAMFTQYMYNKLAINPAYAGSQDMLSLTALGRYQWTGIDGAPTTHTFSAHTPVKHDRMGLGVLFISDQIGITNQNSMYFSYAYRVPLSRNDLTLSMGLQAGLSNFGIKFTDANVSDIGDQIFNQGDITQMFPNFGVGFFLTAPKFYIGISVPQLMNNSLDITQAKRSVQQRNYFLESGYVFTLNKSLKFKPSFLIKAIEGLPIQFDINASILIEEVLWLGISYRSFNSIDGLAEFQLTDQIKLGYAYDLATSSEMRSIDGGSHEIMINYRLVFSKRKIITPRYY